MKVKRIVAFLIDFFSTTLIIGAIAIIMVFLKSFLTGQQSVILVASFTLPFVLLGEIYPIFRDIIGGRISIGKRFVNIRLVSNDGTKPSLFRLFLYDVTVLIWPIEAFLLLFKGKTIGEHISGLVVAKTSPGGRDK